jgi:hypothetical protein
MKLFLKNSAICVIVLYLSYLGISCNTSLKNSSQNLPKYEISIVDSIKLNTLGNFRVVDYHDSLECFLAVDFRAGDIIIVNKKGSVIHKLNKIGEYSDAIGEWILGASFYKNSQIALLGKSGIFFYNFNGELDFKIIRNDKGLAFITSQFKLKPFSLKNKNYILCTLENLTFDKLGTKLTPEYYQSARLLTLVDLEKKSFKEIVPYPQESIYRKEKAFYDSDKPIFDYSTTDSSIYVLFGFEDIVYKFYGNNFTNYEVLTSTNPSNMQTLPGTLFTKSPPQEDILKYTFLSGSYNNIFSNNDTIYATYYSGIPKEKIEHNLSLQEYIEFYRQFNKYYLQVFVKEKKICSDVVLPDKSSYIDYITKAGLILLHQNKLSLKQDIDYQIIYIGKLTKK